MKIILSDPIGFCKGVSRAVDLARKLALERKGENIETLGDLIHNPLEVKRLETLGIHPITDLSLGHGGILILRTHGTPADVKQKAERMGYELIEAACHKVLKVQDKAVKLRNDGYGILIFGDAGHPETEALVSISGPDAVVIKSVEDLESLEINNDVKYALIAQTTSDREGFNRTAELLKQKSPGAKIVDTLCGAVERRIKSALNLAGKVDRMIVAGGRNSANTRRMFDSVSQINENTIWIETAEDLPDDFNGIKSVGIASGASTPKWILDLIVERLKTF